MFGSLGFPEITFILILALLIFGPRKLPEIGRTLGRGLGEFRRATNDLKRSIETEIAAEEAAPRPAGVSSPTQVMAASEPQDRPPATEPRESSAPSAEEAEPEDGDGRTEA